MITEIELANARLSAEQKVRKAQETFLKKFKVVNYGNRQV